MLKRLSPTMANSKPLKAISSTKKIAANDPLLIEHHISKKVRTKQYLAIHSTQPKAANEHH